MSPPPPEAGGTLRSGLEELERADESGPPFKLTKVELKLLGIAGVGDDCFKCSRQLTFHRSVSAWMPMTFS